MRLIRRIRLIKPIFFFFSAVLVAGALIFLFSYFSKPAQASWPPALRAVGSESLMNINYE
ncbi:MAG: hypothetical protein UU73_C0007G0013 [Candidatus Daviesbacteria bacterium GW2011_GWA1_41_61]|nr:MAG: hypothetical protein UU26_C0014G0003 [Candidatus Daviesbacteria bacterium GW2011_GWC1_40_9]KKR92747.1 MAG: hypothetical protein UU44_C0005G0077 [Candidatus Daviesbacteria bacterium GW2011_GWB1_41_15]KKS14506.1 MAG: hypothetical protein UU73_C0007G0013 [Candidatus Daviesbacteria bacterium GW2011_GWA1_41_61]